MDISRAKEIISALAEGIDPTTGEILPCDSLYNKGDIVRAFYAVLKFCDDKEEAREQKKQKNKEPDNYDIVLYNRLRDVRNKIAEEKRTMPFRILPNYPLMHMALHKPLTKKEFLKIYGVGKYTTDQYSDIFISEIKKYIFEK